MSIQHLCSGDIFEVYRKSSDRWGQGFEHEYEERTVEGNLQFVGGVNEVQYDANGAVIRAEVFFSSDPNLDETKTLKFIGRTNGTHAPSKPWFMVEYVYTEGPPGQSLLWIAVCRQHTVRGDLSE